MSILAGTRDASLGSSGAGERGARQCWGDITLCVRHMDALGQRCAQGIPVLEALVADEHVVLQREAELTALRVVWSSVGAK